MHADDPIPPAATATDVDTEIAHRRAVNRRHVLMLIAPIIPMWAAAQLGGMWFPWLSTENPTLLITLSAANRNLIIAGASAQSWFEAGNAMPLVLFAVIGVVRLLAPDPFFYAIGTHYGEHAISWMERRTPTFGEMLRQLEHLFTKAGWLLVLVLPNNYVCLLAGAARMRRVWFWSLNIAGTIGRVGLMYFVGLALQEWIDRVLGFMSDHRGIFLAISIGFVGFTLLREWRSGTSEVQSLIELEHELEEELDHELEEELSDDQV